MRSQVSDVRSPRERLLDAASELFYDHGVHTVGIDAIIDHAGVAKASLYNTFGSKEELVRAYLEARYEARRETMLAAMEMYEDPKGKLLAVFNVLATTVRQPGFRGCAFANASAESERDSAAADVTRKVRAWLLRVMTEQVTALGATDPGRLARQLTLLFDGALAQARLDQGLAAATAARAAAELLIDAATTTRKPRVLPTRAANNRRN
jgi:AcrR family transcriptional regulator